MKTFKFNKGYIDESITRDEEKEIAIEILDRGCFWLDNTFCMVCSIERNDRHYFINYEDRISSQRVIKNIIVSQLKEVSDDE